MRRLLGLFGIRLSHRHDWSPWSEMEYVGSEYHSNAGKLFYAQRRRCFGCNLVETKQTVIVGRHEEAVKRELTRKDDPLFG